MQAASNFNLFSVTFTLSMGILILYLPRKYAFIPFILAASYITIGQRVVFFTLHFNVLRILVLFGFARLFIRKEFVKIELNKIDRAIIFWIITSILMYTICRDNYRAFIFVLGRAYDALGIYFIVRSLVKSYDDYDILFKSLAVIIIPVAVLMLIESNTGRNFFSIFGGVPEFSEIRKGHIRCEGPFRHPILAGTFGATIAPLFISLWWHKGKGKLYSALGFICASIVVFTAYSSGPLMAYIFGIMAIMAWFIRAHMKKLRWGILFSLVVLQMAMKAPIWFLIARLSDATGGGGWHRSQLIDQAVKHFGEWWLVGTSYTAHWKLPMTLAINPDMVDITNEYIRQGLDGGLITLVLFILIIVVCFKNIGSRVQANTEESFAFKFTLWSMGAALFAHAASFISVSYFDQIVVFWYMLLALIANLTIDSNPLSQKVILQKHNLARVTRI